MRTVEGIGQLAVAGRGGESGLTGASSQEDESEEIGRQRGVLGALALAGFLVRLVDFLWNRPSRADLETIRFRPVPDFTRIIQSC